MPWKVIHIRHKLAFATYCSGAANSTAKGYCLARYLAMERSQDQLVCYRLVEDVEASPLDAVTGTL